MSMRLILILSVLLLSNVSGADKAAAPAAPAPAAPAASAAAPAKEEKKKEKGDDGEKKDNKMKIGGGLYTTDKVANVKSMKGNRPVSLRLPTFFLTPIYFIRL